MNIDDIMWNPWHGYHKVSEGCQNCFSFYLDRRYNRDTTVFKQNSSTFDLPIKKTRDGYFKIPSGSFVRVCMTSDFFLEEADVIRQYAWQYIDYRKDVNFSLLTKRANRMKDCLPSNWGSGWDNCYFAVSCENQKRADERIPYLIDLPAKHKWISLKPFIGEIDLEDYLATGEIETVLAGGENYEGYRPLYYEWVEKVYKQCVAHNVEFIFGQTGNVFIMNGKTYEFPSRYQQMKAAIVCNMRNPQVDVDQAVAELDRRQAEKQDMKSRYRR